MASVLDLLDLCQNCAHLTFTFDTPADGSTPELDRCPICCVPMPVDTAGGRTEAWGSRDPQQLYRDPYLSRASMHLCNGCDRIVQDERAWEVRKRGGHFLQCRVCRLPVPAERSLPLDGPHGADGLLVRPLPPRAGAVGAADGTTDRLVELVRAGHHGAAAELGAHHRQMRDTLDANDLVVDIGLAAWESPINL